MRGEGPLARRWGQPDPSDLEELLAGARSRIPVPSSTDRAAWGQVQPSAVAAILAEGEADRIQPWPQPKLSQYARFWRDGVRTSYEGPATELCRRTSVDVVAAALTGAEEWLDEAADGLLMLCEQTGWCWAAHEGFASRRGHVVPDPTDPYLDLGAGETGAVLAWADLVLAEALDTRVRACGNGCGPRRWRGSSRRSCKDATGTGSACMGNDQECSDAAAARVLAARRPGAGRSRASW